VYLKNRPFELLTVFADKAARRHPSFEGGTTLAELKTKQTDESVSDFLSGISDEKVKRDCLVILKLMKGITGAEPKMWGSSIVGFGKYCYRYQSGRELEWFQTGFSPRKQNLTLYIMPGFAGYADLMKRLGKHKTGVSCLYIKSLDDIDKTVLEELIRQSVKHLSKARA
jgi:hypothetical protein